MFNAIAIEFGDAVFLGDGWTERDASEMYRRMITWETDPMYVFVDSWIAFALLA